MFFFWQRIFFGLVMVIPMLPELSAQQISEADSSVNAALIYSLRLDEIERKISILKSRSFDEIWLQEIDKLAAEAQQYATQRAYVYANLLLDEIFELLDPPPLTTLDSLSLIYSPKPSAITRHVQTMWSRELVGGLDFWDQRFEMESGGNDTVLSTGMTNPFVGLRLGLEHGIPQQTWTVADLQLRQSRDYFAANHAVTFTRTLRQHTRLVLNNVLDWTRYHQDRQLSYFQNNLKVLLQIAPTPGWRVYLDEQFLIRDYAQESDFLYSYFENQWRLALDYSSLQPHQGSLGIRFSNRTHPHLATKDFRRGELDFSETLQLGARLQLYFDTDLNYKHYAAVNDSLYQANYWEQFLNLKLIYQLHRGWNLNFENRLNWRKYSVQFTYLRNIMEYEGQISIDYSIKTMCNVNFGYIYSMNRNWGAAGVDDVPMNLDNLTAHGISIGFEYYLTDAITLHFSNVYKNRRYPNSKDIASWSIYSDRHLNSLFLFCNWSITAGYQLNLMANYDAERSLRDNHSDSQNTLCACEFIRKF
ncbi:hypothetical protein L0128_21290 [candidate division KSB1 bacterium]|nr:hypothetical protein [candidate division KSB1 bacterium]